MNYNDLQNLREIYNIIKHIWNEKYNRMDEMFSKQIPKMKVNI